jgi:type II secretory pathway pseudopilin PulG
MSKADTLSGSTPGAGMERHEEQGFMLVGLIVAIFFILLALSVAAPKMAQELRREREVEAVHRGNQYVRAIRLYYRKFGHYPGSMDLLEKTNNIRFLRQQYVDPMTGKADWRLIKVGEAKTTVKGFFGQPLAGLTPGLGSAAGAASAGPAGAGAAGTGPASSTYGGSSPGSNAYGGSSPSGGGLGSPSSGLGGTSSMPTLGGGNSTGGATNGPPTLGSDSSGSGQTGSGQTAAGAGSTNTLGSLSGSASQSNGSSMSGGAPFVGVGVPKEGDSITVLNEQTTYNTWEFLYDPRIEQLYAKGALMGGGASGLGSAAGNSSGFGGTPSSGFGATPGSGSGTTPGSGFGATPGSGYGSPSGSGFGSAPGTSSPTTPTTPAPPQQPQQ